MMPAMRTLALVVCLFACGKTSTSTPDNTGSGTGTTTTTTATDAGAAKPVATLDAGSATLASGSGDIFDQSIAKLDGLKTTMCACKDTQCATKVFDEYKAWRLDMKKAIAGKKPTKPQEDKANALDKELSRCKSNIDAGVTNIGSAGSGSGSDPFAAALVEMEGFKTKMCACTDKACADKVQEDIKTWDRLMRSKITAKPTDAQKVRGQGLENEIKECRKKAETATAGAAGAGPKIDAMLVKMGGFKDKVCACKDKPCLEAVDKEMTAWMAEAAKGLADAKPTKDQDEKADKLQADMKACASKIK
jgi:hypothetical protein